MYIKETTFGYGVFNKGKLVMEFSTYDEAREWRNYYESAKGTYNF